MSTCYYMQSWVSVLPLTPLLQGVAHYVVHCVIHVNYIQHIYIYIYIYIHIYVIFLSYSECSILLYAIVGAYAHMATIAPKAIKAPMTANAPRGCYTYSIVKMNAHWAPMQP